MVDTIDRSETEIARTLSSAKVHDRPTDLVACGHGQPTRLADLDLLACAASQGHHRPMGHHKGLAHLACGIGPRRGTDTYFSVLLHEHNRLVKLKSRRPEQCFGLRHAF